MRLYIIMNNGTKKWRDVRAGVTPDMRNFETLQSLGRGSIRNKYATVFAIIRADGIVIACSRLTAEQTAALYAVIGRTETEAA